MYMIYLEPGEAYFAESPTSIVTILGSCLAVSMWLPRLRVGAICHAFLPKCLTWNKCQSHCQERFKYVHCTIPWMVEQLSLPGVRRSEIETKLFGGGDLFVPSMISGNNLSVGKQNTVMALEMFKKEGLIVASQDLGGTMGRKIIFNTGTGEVLLKRIKQTETHGSERSNT
jgi:chemotaxis protein CheD